MEHCSNHVQVSGLVEQRNQHSYCVEKVEPLGLFILHLIHQTLIQNSMVAVKLSLLLKVFAPKVIRTYQQR